MSRRLSRSVVGSGATLLCAGFMVVAQAGPAAAADITSVCTNSTTAGTTITLTGDCATTVPLTVPDGFTLDGGGFKITASDPASGPFTGAVVSNGGTSMHIVNLTVQGAFAVNSDCGAVNANDLRGIFFNDADGNVDHVTVLDITQQSGCQVGDAIRANAFGGTPRVVTVTNSTASGFQKNGVTGSGLVTLNVSGSTIGPPGDHPPGVQSTNSVQYGVGGAGGSFTNNNVIGSGFGSDTDFSAAILLFDAANVSIDHNTLSGAGTDIGISVTASRNVDVSFNTIARDAPDSPDASGIGVRVDADSAATTQLVCNTYSGWETNTDGAVEQPCPTTTTTSVPTSTTAGPGVGGGTVTRSEPLARTGRSSTPLVTTGIISVMVGLALLLVASERRSRLRHRPSNPS